MKKFLLIISALVVLLVIAFVVFVSSIDWNEHKAKIAAQFSSLTGKRVVFEGAVELTFFPSPYLTVENVKIYNDNQQDNKPLAQINRLVANLELMPFIKGEFNVKKMSLVHPMVNVQVLENGHYNWDTELTPEQRTKMAETPVKLDSLSIEKATLTIKDTRKGIDWTFRNLSAEVKADSLLGPFRIEGSYIKDSNPAGFAFSIGRLDTNMSTTVNAVINSPASQTMLRFDGSVLPKQELISGNVVFESKKLRQFVTENFKNINFDEKYDLPLAFSTQVNTNPQKVELSNFVVKYGDTTGAGNVIVPVMNGNSDTIEKTENKLEFAFNLTDLDLAPVVYFLTNELKKYDEAGKFVLDYKSDIIADIRAVNVKYGAHQMRDAELSLDILKDKINVNSLKANLVGDTKLEAWGAFFAGKEGDLRYQSEVRLRSEEIVSLLKEWGINPQTPVATVYRNFNGVAKIEGGLNEVKFTPVEFILDKTKVSGEAALARDNDKVRILVIADVDGVNFDNYLVQMSDEVREGTLNQKLLYAFSHLEPIKNADLQCQINLGWGIYDNLPFEKLALDAQLKDEVWNINKLNIPNLSGATIDLSGKVKGYGDKFEFENLKYNIESADIFAWLSKFSVELPDWEISDFKSFKSSGVMSGAPDMLALKNTAQLEKLELSYDGTINSAENAPQYKGKLFVKAPDFLKMLGSFKINYTPNVYSLGVFTFNGDVETKGNVWEVKNLNTMVGQNQFQGYLTYTKDGLTKKFAGNLKINQFEPERFFYNGVAQRANKDVVSFKSENGEKVNFLPKPIWDTTKINYGLYKNLDLDLKLDIEKLMYKNIIFQNSKLGLSLQDEVLKVTDIVADYAKGKINGNVNLNFSAIPVIDGTIKLTKVNLDDSFWNGDKYGFNYGTISSSTTFSSGADSVEDMIKSLEAESEFKLERVEFKGFNPAEIEEDLQQRSNADGLSQLVMKNLESGKTPIHLISGKMKINKGDYVLENMNFSSPLGYTMTMSANGNLLLWDVNAQFGIVFRKVSLPAINFGLKGTLTSPELSVDVSGVAEFYQKRKDEMTAKLKAEEESRLRILQTGMTEQMNITKAMEKRLNDELRVGLTKVMETAKSDKVKADLINLEAELDNIGKGISEVLSLGAGAQIEQAQIDDAKRRNGLLQKRIDNAVNMLQNASIDDVKYRTNISYNKIANIYELSKIKLNEYKQYADALKKRLDKIETTYSLKNDAQVTAYNAVIESLFVELDDINTELSYEYVKMQNTVDTTLLAEYENEIMSKVTKAERNQAQLTENIDLFYTYSLPQVEREEKLYAEKLRKAEIERKVKENTGKISVAGVGGKSVTVVRDIEDIEKSETLQEQEKIPVLDFSKPKSENVIVNREARLRKSSTENQKMYLQKSQGQISAASGVIVRK